MQKILITGGLGYIGSHIILNLYNYNNNFLIDIVDDCSNSTEHTFYMLSQFIPDLNLYKINLCNKYSINKLIADNKYDLVIHLAGFKSITESINNPIHYYNNNLIGTINLLSAMENNKCYNLIFSSSASVYGINSQGSTENTTTGNGITNPYSKSKYFIEEMLKDLYNSNTNWNIAILRYYNPIGAHPSRLIGDAPESSYTNLMPYISNVLLNKTPYLTIYGNDYDTYDGTCVRDFIHVVDLADAHRLVLIFLLNNSNNFKIYNVGTNNGISVLDVIKMMENVSGKKINYVFSDRRPGDLDKIYSDSSLIQTELNWKPKYSLYDMCLSHWNYINLCLNAINL